jgi:hypothetical protein
MPAKDKETKKRSEKESETKVSKQSTSAKSKALSEQLADLTNPQPKGNHHHSIFSSFYPCLRIPP